MTKKYTRVIYLHLINLTFLLIRTKIIIYLCLDTFLTSENNCIIVYGIIIKRSIGIRLEIVDSAWPQCASLSCFFFFFKLFVINIFWSDDPVIYRAYCGARRNLPLASRGPSRSMPWNGSAGPCFRGQKIKYTFKSATAATLPPNILERCFRTSCVPYRCFFFFFGGEVIDKQRHGKIYNLLHYARITIGE